MGFWINRYVLVVLHWIPVPALIGITLGFETNRFPLETIVSHFKKLSSARNKHVPHKKPQV